MLIVGLFSWWYGAGWLQRVIAVRDRFLSLYDYFSIDLLIRSLFSPFRQISAGQVQGPIGVQIRAFFDRLISRVIGAIVRLIIMTIGIVALILQLIVGLVQVLVWPLIPVLPILAIFFSTTGWIPWKI